MKVNRRVALAALTAVAVISPQAHAADWPTRPVTIYVTTAAGGNTDLMARMAAEHLSAKLGKPFVVENVGGAGGTIGASQVVKSKPDGYTLVAATPGPITISPVAQKDIPYDVRQLTAITMIAGGPGALVVRRDSPYKSVQELVAAAKAKPGQLSFGSAGVGAFSHLSSELFKALAGINAVHVPYKGTGPALIDLLGGRLDFVIEYFAALQKQIDAGELRALAVTTPQRFPLRPDIPTMQEAGVPGYDASAWYGMLAPAGTPPAIVDKLNAEIAKILAMPDIKERFAAGGAETVTMTSAALDTRVPSDTV